MHTTRGGLLGLQALLLVASQVSASEQPVDARYAAGGEEPAVRLRVGEALHLLSPPEGLWSIGAGWKDGWPEEWRHAHPRTVRRAGPWTILEGRLAVDGGEWILRDAYREDGDTIRGVRRFQWTGKEPLRDVTLSVRFRAPALSRGVDLPGILYHGNPSGERSGRVPVYHGRPAEEALYEEHRYPIPFASMEWKATDGAWRGAALHTLPTPAPYGRVQDQWWSLGVIARDAATDLTLLSGPCASNGRRSVIKAVQPGFVPYPPAVLDVPPGAVIEKTFRLQAYPVAREGDGFRPALRSALGIWRPEETVGLPGFREIIEAKHRFALSRWHETAESAGFRKYPDRPFYVVGWCGQAASCGYALQVLHDLTGGERDLEMAQRSLDFLSGAGFHDQGFHTWYDYAQRRWLRVEPLSEGQGMWNTALAIGAAERSGLDSRRWRTFLRKACDVHSRRILAEGWRPRSTDQAFFIAPLCLAARIFGEEGSTYRKAAIHAGNVYRDRHISMREPYWGGTLDARCEDKEGAYAALQGFLALHELTGDEEFLAAAGHALDVVVSYVVVWDIDLPAGRLRDHGFRTRGWTVVSPQNQHIDAYGVLMAPDVYRYGQITGRPELQRLALVMFRSCGQLVDPFGSHGEQPQHTNYAQRGRVRDIFALRGGYQEHWTVFWLTAHFLHAAARLRDLGVDVSE